MVDKLRILFLGTTNELSRSALATLLSGGVTVDAVIVTATAARTTGNIPLEELRPAASASELPLVNRYHRPSLIEQAWSSSVLVLALGNEGYSALRRLIEGIQPDAVCVACFPRRIPETLLKLPRFGFLNVHPSLLPHYRGPAPLFWLFQRNDLEHRGVTVHQMDEDLDTGPIVTQKPLALANGQSQAMIESQCGRLGGHLLLDGLSSLSKGGAAGVQTGAGSYYPWPSAGDFRISTGWSAQHAFNFMRATDGFSMGYQVSLPDKELYLTEALHVDPEGEIGALVYGEDTIVRLRFSPGILTARVGAS
jgi:methionyl-tRNA formyltransferase